MGPWCRGRAHTLRVPAVAALAMALLAGGACSAGEPEGRTGASGSTADVAASSAAAMASSTSTVATTTIPPPPTMLLPEAGPEPCPGAPSPVAGDRIASGLDEVSGMASSRRSPSHYWVVEDRGNAPVLVALDGSGAATARVTLTGRDGDDWEDMAAVSGGPTGGRLYIGDIGDNDFARKSINVLVVVEPSPDSGERVLGPDEIAVVELVFPDRPRDVEALAVDPARGDLVLITKQLNPDGLTSVWKAPASPGRHTLVEEARLDLGALSGAPGQPSAVTGADVSPDGGRIALRTYGDVWIFDRPGDEPVWDSLLRTPCRWATGDEPAGEAITFSPDGSAIWTLSEGDRPRRWETVLA